MIDGFYVKKVGLYRKAVNTDAKPVNSRPESAPVVNSNSLKRRDPGYMTKYMREYRAKAKKAKEVE